MIQNDLTELLPNLRHNCRGQSVHFGKSFHPSIFNPRATLLQVGPTAVQISPCLFQRPQSSRQPEAEFTPLAYQGKQFVKIVSR